MNNDFNDLELLIGGDLNCLTHNIINLIVFLLIECPSPTLFVLKKTTHTHMQDEGPIHNSEKLFKKCSVTILFVLLFSVVSLSMISIVTSKVLFRQKLLFSALLFSYCLFFYEPIVR
jgi:hypothetical protein